MSHYYHLEPSFDVFYDAEQAASTPALLLVAPSPVHRFPTRLPSTTTSLANFSSAEFVPVEPPLTHSRSVSPLLSGSQVGDDDDQLGFELDEQMPRGYTDENGQQVFPCPHCNKTYNGKHARSIWRRHLQDKHSIPLSQQPRRTRWDNVADRPKTDDERRERTLESKRRWARKNRASLRARAAGLPVPTDADFDENGFPWPGTQLAAVVNAIRRTSGTPSDASLSHLSAEQSPLLLPIEEDESGGLMLAGQQDIDVEAHRHSSPRQRATSLAPFTLTSRPTFHRNVSEPPLPASDTAEESASRLCNSDMPHLVHHQAGTIMSMVAAPQALAQSSMTSMIDPELLSQSYVEGSPPMKRSLAPLPDNTSRSKVFASPRRSLRLAQEANGVSSEEAAMQLLALKTSSPANSPSKAGLEDSFATTGHSTMLMSDFSFHLPHEGSSPASSPAAQPSKVALKRSMVVVDTAPEAAEGESGHGEEEESEMQRPSKRRRSARLDTPHRPLLPLHLGRLESGNGGETSSSPESDHVSTTGFAHAARIAFAQSTPFHAGGSASTFRSSPAAFLFSSPGNTDLSRSLGLVPDSKLSVFGTPGLKNSSPMKPDFASWAIPGYPVEPLSSPDKSV